MTKYKMNFDEMQDQLRKITHICDSLINYSTGFSYDEGDLVAIAYQDSIKTEIKRLSVMLDREENL